MIKNIRLYLLRVQIVCLLYAIMLCPAFNIYAQPGDIKFKHLSIEQGLSQSYANCIVKDNNGFIWIGTETGLNKYDGYTFTVYESDVDNLNSLSNSYILSIFKDRNGIFWVGTEKGLNRFDPGKDQFTRYLHDSDDPYSISHNRVYSICEDDNGSIWVGTENGLNRFDQQKKKFFRYYTYADNPKNLSNNNVRSVYIDKSGVLWIGTYGGGLNRFDHEKEEFICYKNIPGDPVSLSNNNVLSIYEDMSGILWIGTDGGVNRFDPEKRQFACYRNIPDDPNSISDNQVNVIYEDKTGALWIGTGNGGLNVFNREKERFVCYKNSPENPASLSNNRVLSIGEDNSGGLWFGTRGGGINIFNRETQKFVHYKPDPNNPNSLNNNMIWNVSEDRHGILWIGTDVGGLNRFDRKKNKFKHYTHNPVNPKSLSYNRVISICEDKSGVLWIGTYEGLNKFNRGTGQFIHYKFDPDAPYSLSDNRVTCMIEDQSGVLWIGTKGGGINKFNRETEQFIRYKFDSDNPYSLSDNKVYSIYEDRSGTLWIGTFGGGLNKFDNQKEQFIRYQLNPDDPNSLGDNFIFSIYEDQSGILWIGTAYGGLNRLDRSKNNFTHFTVKDGLPDNTIYMILEDDKGNLWVSTNKGISKFDPKTKEFKNYDEKDGLQSNEFNSGAAHKSKSGEMFFGGINGFNSFFPDSIRDNPYIPPVAITDFKIFNKPVPIGKMPDGRTILEKSIIETKEIKLSYKENVFSFEFSALHYVAPGMNQYAYMMGGFDKEWNYVGNRRYVSYTNLPPGEYVFRVKGSNNDGVWNEEGTSLKIKIIPPYWRTWWFYTLCVIVIVFLVVMIFIYQINKIKKKKEEEARLEVITDVGQVLEHGSATIYRRNLDSDVYDYIGNGIRDITGYSPEEFTLPIWYKIVISEELIGEYSGLSVEEAYKRMQGGSIDSFVSDFSLRTKSGDVRWARDITTALRDESGKCYAYLGIIFDITDRKLAEQELAAKGKSIQRTLFEHTADPIVIFDKETHKFLDCNRAALRSYGYSIDEFRAMTPFDLHPREDRRKVNKNIDVRNVDVPNVYKHITKDGRRIDVEILSDETVYEGRAAWISIVHNVTERKQAERKLAVLSEELSEKNKEMEKDLDMARDVQMALLSQNYPKNFPENVPPKQSALQFSHRYIPASTLAGDFFEIFPISDHQVGVMIYDVMGHGVRASLLTAYLHGLVEELMPIAAKPVMFIKRLNVGLTAIMEQFLTGMFATAFYLVADIKKGKMYFTNAGHPKPYILRRSKGTVEKLEYDKKHVEPALGLFNRFNYTVSECSMNKDDIILFFTDGVYEVMGTSKEIFGEKKLMASVKNKLNTPPEQMLDGILDEINKYSGTSEFSDDVCLVSMHVRKASLKR